MRVFWKHTVPPIDPNSLPKDADVLRKIVVDLCEQLRHESSEKDKYRSLLRELLDAQRNRKSEQLSKGLCCKPECGSVTTPGSSASGTGRDAEQSPNERCLPSDVALR